MNFNGAPMSDILGYINIFRSYKNLCKSNKDKEVKSKWYEKFSEA